MTNNTQKIEYANYVDVNADASKKFIAKVFAWMFVALGISTLCATLFANDVSLLSLLIDMETGRRTGLGTIVMFAPLAFMLIMSFGINKIAYPVMMFLFIAFATTMGISLSFIFLLYTSGSITGVFLSSSLLFGVMAVLGYTTDTDLTKLGSLLTMALLGMVIASVVNMFLGSSQMQYIISFVGIIVFTGLTAYDVQKLKRIGAGIEFGDASTSKMVLMGALTLYLDFINLFLSMLRVFGNRR
ncbi:MAG: Bax inhibitor-1/YccA family protein [Sphingobacteriales bacterium]|nr:MAG: Bax inhibitor-1/YccA family protein [Sphingobacteriales bacterium]TAF83137.1 MAG: Bax inhibitor-1/YccA family protein [Sphingobacteriales bacterium]